MNSEMTALARGLKCDGFGANGLAPTGVPSQAPLAGVPRDEIGQYQVAEGVEVFTVTKKIGFADRDFLDQRVHFGGAPGGIAQQVEIGAAILKAESG